jgi:hypothetical protein
MLSQSRLIKSFEFETEILKKACNLSLESLEASFWQTKLLWYLSDSPYLRSQCRKNSENKTRSFIFFFQDKKLLPGTSRRRKDSER